MSANRIYIKTLIEITQFYTHKKKQYSYNFLHKIHQISKKQRLNS